MPVTQRLPIQLLINQLEDLMAKHGPETPVFIETRSQQILTPELREDRASAGAGPAKLVSRQGVACIVIGPR
jgi:hypothetical protein